MDVQPTVRALHIMHVQQNLARYAPLPTICAVPCYVQSLCWALLVLSLLLAQSLRTQKRVLQPVTHQQQHLQSSSSSVRSKSYHMLPGHQG